MASITRSSTTFNWFKKFGDPDFIYEQEMARVFGLKPFAWQTLTCCPTTTKSTAKNPLFT